MKKFVAKDWGHWDALGKLLGLAVFRRPSDVGSGCHQHFGIGLLLHSDHLWASTFKQSQGEIACCFSKTVSAVGSSQVKHEENRGTVIEEPFYIPDPVLARKLTSRELVKRYLIMRFHNIQ